MDDNHCVFKYTRGKKSGNFCCKKINTNLEDNKKYYLCCSHSKNIYRINIISEDKDNNNKNSVNDIISIKEESIQKLKKILKLKTRLKKIKRFIFVVLI